MRDEVKSKLEAKYLKMENETRSKCYSEIKNLNTVEMEKFKINAQNESA